MVDPVNESLFHNKFYELDIIVETSIIYIYELFCYFRIISFLTFHFIHPSHKVDLLSFSNIKGLVTLYDSGHIFGYNWINKDYLCIVLHYRAK